MENTEPELSLAQRELIDHFVALAKLVGLPKSVGEIYGLLYVSEQPLAMDQIIAHLGISIGSASQGLKQLKAFKAVRIPYRPGERKDYYEAEPEIKKVVAGFLKEQVYPLVEVQQERMKALKADNENGYATLPPFLRARFDALDRWQSRGLWFLKKAGSLIKL